jgi:hypothetical protein
MRGLQHDTGECLAFLSSVGVWRNGARKPGIVEYALFDVRGRGLS